MNDENKDKKLSDDIRDWHYLIDKDKVVIFEEYKNTLERSNNLEEDENPFNSDEDEESPINLKQLAVYHSPMGPVIVPEFNDPTKHFKLWTMYTNIPLTQKVLFQIETTEGIESLEPLSRYRARIGIGPLFKDATVIGNITKIIKDSEPISIKKLLNEL